MVALTRIAVQLLQTSSHLQFYYSGRPSPSKLRLQGVTAHPRAAWTLQQLREVVGYEDRYRHLIHDRDSIFARHLDYSIEALGLSVLKLPPRCP